MNFQCKNCGGNMVYSPEKKNLYCPFCEGVDTGEVKGDRSLTVCPSCGGELTVGQFTSSSRCPYCNNYLVFDERVEGEYKPDMIIPFSVSKEQAVKNIDNTFKKRTFTPSTFLSEKSLKGMDGYYVPFFLYNYDAEGNYRGMGTKVRSWRSGNYNYTETSFFDVERKMLVSYENVPADASEEMNDEIMDLMEPYNYKLLTDFDPRFMSGFFGEVYNDTKEKYEDRAKKKVVSSASALLHNSLNGYATLTPSLDTTSLTGKDTYFAIFPVWKYDYTWAGKDYPIYVNGQSGKVVGKTPVSKLKVLFYSLTAGGLTLAIASLLLSIAEVLG